MQVFQPNKDKRIESMELRVVANNFEGELTITDIMFQGGAQVTAYIPHTSEILKLVESTINENDTAQGNDEYQNFPPEVYEGVKNRFFNFIGRGHEVIVIPNVYHEDYSKPIMMAGLDLTIYPKDNYDLLKISTNFGTQIESWDRVYWGLFEEHPLHKRYTKEFYMSGATAGTEIKLHTSTRTATVGGVPQPQGIRHFNVGEVNGETKILTTPRQSFMVMPVGSYRIRVEFYKRVSQEISNAWGGVDQVQYMRDTGIGFTGVAEFTQYTLGGGKI